MNRYESRLVRTDHLQSVREVFQRPILLGVASIIGLISALLGNGVWDALSWMAILTLVLTVFQAWRKRVK